MTREFLSAAKCLRFFRQHDRRLHNNLQATRARNVLSIASFLHILAQKSCSEHENKMFNLTLPLQLVDFVPTKSRSCSA